jgi:hypothetical protein
LVIGCSISGLHLTEESEREVLKVWFGAILGDAPRNFHHRYAGRSGVLAVDHPDRNSPQKHVWRARIIVLTADGTGTIAITRAVGKGKTVVWPWQERFMHEGVDGLTRDKTRRSRIPPLPAATVDRVIALTNQAPPHEATHYAVSRIMPHGRALRRVNLFRAMRQFGIIEPSGNDEVWWEADWRLQEFVFDCRHRRALA